MKLFRAQRLRIILWLAWPLLSLAACQQVLVPLDQQQALQAREPEQIQPALVRIATSWAGQPLVADLAAAQTSRDAYLSVDVLPGNSSLALNLVSSGQADLALINQAINLADPAVADQLQPLNPRVVALDALGIVVHKNSSLNDLPKEKLAALFAGEQVDWAELGAGQGQPILVSREAGAAERTLFEARIMGEKQISTAAVIMPHDRGVVEYVAEHPEAIGYASLAWVDERVRLVSIDRILPTQQTIRRGTYPLVQPLVLLTSPQAPEVAQRLAALAAGPQGRAVVERRYVLPR